MYKNKTVSLILPAYNEEECIQDVIMGFDRVGVFDEIIVVDNNSSDKTLQLARGTRKVEVVQEKHQGYGFALRKGLSVAKGDIFVLCDADNTYSPNDVFRLLKYSPAYDCVFSTRTNKRYNLKGSNMYGPRKYANILIGRMMQFLFNGPPMTDIGSTFRLLHRYVYKKLESSFLVGGIHFQPELTILTLLNGFTIKEVPVHYGPRTGVSKISGPIIGGIKTATKMVGIILYYRLGPWFSREN